MELFDEIDEFHQLLMKETSAKLDCDLEGFQDLETKYANLHDSYTKEIENSKKVEKCLLKCLKFYSKLSKKYEAQQKIIITLEESIKEKVHSLEESLRTQEKLRGVIEVYRTERNVYTGITFESLTKDKQLLLDICCKLISEAPETDNVRSLGNLILKKFKKDLDDNKLIKLMKLRHIPIKNETKQEIALEDMKPPSFTEVKSEDNVKEENSLDNTCSPVSIEEKPKTEKNLNNCIEVCEESNSSTKDDVESDEDDDDLVSVEENERDLSLPLLDVSLISNEKPEEEKINFSYLGSSKNENNLEIDKTNFKIKENNLQLGEADILKCKKSKSKKEESDNIKETNQFLNVSTYGLKTQHFRNSDIENSSENFSANEKNLSSNYGIFSSKNQLQESTVINTANAENINSKICDDRFNEEEKERFNHQFESSKSSKKKVSNSSSSKDSTALEINSQSQKQSVISKSIFDVPEINVNTKKNNSTSTEQFVLEFDNLVEKERNDSQKNLSSYSQQADFCCDINSSELNEEDLCKIFRETSNVRLLSPIKELTDTDKNLISNKKTETFVKTKSENSSEYKRKRNLSSSSGVSEPTTRSKKIKSSESQAGFLDSIMSAMSQQNEEFKAIKKVVVDSKPEMENKEENIVVYEKSSPPETRSPSLIKKNSRENYSQKSSRRENDKSEKTVVEELKKFVSCSINSKEEADRSVKQCVSVLRNKSEQMVARCVVGIVFENVDENVELFERPAPPLTKTQHRLIVLLSVFKTLDPESEKISYLILNLIWEKLLPDKFFWPDDCVETATRFYTALCRSQNDVKTLWKFCLQAMTEMKQRCSLVVFTALKTWPDVLHNASTLQNNILAGTIVNIFLHMPKSEGLRNVNQKKKLFALKHLLMNFYQFKVDETIESYTQKVFDAFWKDETGSEKALVLLAKCRDWNWTNKNILFKLKKKLKEWSEEKLEDSEGNKVLSVTKQICTVFVSEGENAAGQAKEIVSCLSAALNSGRLTHPTEQNIIQLLLQLKQYAEARAVIREWKPKETISESLRNEIINVSAENILRELKLNKKKDGFEKKKNSKFKKLKKKSKSKKKKEKKKKKESKVGCIAEL